MAKIKPQDTFTFEYIGDDSQNEPGQGAGSTDSYLNNVWSDNLNYFDGEVPLATPTVASLLEVRPRLRGLMAELNAAENQFWMARHAAMDRSNTFHKGTMDFFRSCLQGASVSVSSAAGVKQIPPPGPFHSCPTVHAHGDNFFTTPPPPNSLSLSSSLRTYEGNNNYSSFGLEDENKAVHFRGNTLKGLPNVSARRQKTSPPCKICATFGLNTPPACPDNPESIYEAYKRNCTYQDVFEKQEVLDHRRDLDPAGPIRELFEINSSPTLDEIGYALLHEAVGMISPTTPANWVQQLIDSLNPSPNPHTHKLALSLTALNSPKGSSLSPRNGISTGTSTKSTTRIRARTFSFPKLKTCPRPRPKSNQSAKSIYTEADDTAIAPLVKLRVSNKLLQVKSQYLDFQKEKAAAFQPHSDDGAQIIEALQLQPQPSSSGVAIADVGGKGDAVIAVVEKVSTTSVSAMKAFNRPSLSSDSFLPLTRPRTRSNTPVTVTTAATSAKKSARGKKPKRKKSARGKKPKRKKSATATAKQQSSRSKSKLSSSFASRSSFRIRRKSPLPRPRPSPSKIVRQALSGLDFQAATRGKAKAKPRTKRRPSTAEFMKLLGNVEHVLEKYKQQQQTALKSQPQLRRPAKKDGLGVDDVDKPKRKRKPFPFLTRRPNHHSAFPLPPYRRIQASQAATAATKVQLSRRSLSLSTSMKGKRKRPPPTLPTPMSIQTLRLDFEQHQLLQAVQAINNSKNGSRRECDSSTEGNARPKK